MDTLNFGRKIALQNQLERLRYLKNNGDIKTFLNEREKRIELYRDLETLNNNSINNLIQEINAGNNPIIDAEITAIESALNQIEDIIRAQGSMPPQTENIQTLIQQYQEHLKKQRQGRTTQQQIREQINAVITRSVNEQGSMQPGISQEQRDMIAMRAAQTIINKAPTPQTIQSQVARIIDEETKPRPGVPNQLTPEQRQSLTNAVLKYTQEITSAIQPINQTAITQTQQNQTREEISYKDNLQEEVKNTITNLLTRETTILKQNENEQINQQGAVTGKILQTAGSILNIPMPDFEAQKPTITAIADAYAQQVTAIPLTTDIPSVLEQCRQTATQTLRNYLPKEIRDEYLKPPQESKPQELTDKGKALVEAMAAASTATFEIKKQEQFKKTVLQEVIQQTIQDTKNATEYIRAIGIQPTTTRNQAQKAQQNETLDSFTQPTTIPYNSATQNEERIKAVQETINAIIPVIKKLQPNATPQEVESAVKIALTAKIAEEPTANKLITPLMDVIVGAATNAYAITQTRYNQPIQTIPNLEIATALEKVVAKATQMQNTQLTQDLTTHLSRLDPTLPADQLQQKAQTIIEETIKQTTAQEIPNIKDASGQLTPKANEIINAMAIAAVQAIKIAPEKQNQTQITQKIIQQPNITTADIAALGFNPEVVQPMQTQSTTQTTIPTRQSAEQAAHIFAKQIQEAAEEYSAKKRLIEATNKAGQDIEVHVKSIIDEINKNAGENTRTISESEKNIIATNIALTLLPRLTKVKNEDLQGVILATIQAELTAEMSNRNPQLLRKHQQIVDTKVAEAATKLADSANIKTAATAQMLLPFAEQAEKSLYKDYVTRQAVGLQRATDKYFQINLKNETITLSPSQILREIYRDDYKTDYRVGIQAIAPELSASLSETLAQDLTAKMFGAVRIVPDYETDQAGFVKTNEDGTPKQKTKTVTVNGEQIEIELHKTFETWGILEDLHDQLTLYEKWAISQLSPEEKAKYIEKREADREKYIFSSAAIAFRVTLEEQHNQLVNTHTAIQARLKELKSKPETQITLQEKKELRILSKQAEKIQSAITQLENFREKIQTDEIEVDKDQLQKLHNKLQASEREERRLKTRQNKLIAIPATELTANQAQRLNEINQQLAILAQRNEELRKTILSLSNDEVNLKEQQKLFQERYTLSRKEKQINTAIFKLTTIGVLTEKQTKQIESLRNLINDIKTTKNQITIQINKLGEKKSFTTIIQNITQNGLRYEEMKKIMAEKETQESKDYQPNWFKLANAKNPFSTIGFLLNPDSGEKSLIGFTLNTPTTLVLGTFAAIGINPEDTTLGILQSVFEGTRDIRVRMFEQKIINLSRATGINIEFMVKTGIIDPGLYNKLSFTHQLQLQLLIREQKNNEKYEELKKKHPRLINWLEKRGRAKNKIWRKAMNEGFTMLLHGRLDALPEIWAKRCITYATNKALLKIAPNIFSYDASKGKIVVKPWETFKNKIKKAVIKRTKKIAKAIAKPIWNRIKNTIVGALLKKGAKLLVGLAAQIIPIVGQAIGIILLVDSIIEKIPIIGQIYSAIKNFIMTLVKIWLLAMLIFFLQTFLWLLQLAAMIGGAIATGLGMLVNFGRTLLSPLTSIQLSAPGLFNLGMINPLNYISQFSTFTTNIATSISTITSSIASTGQAIFTAATAGGPLVTATYAAVTAATIGSLISSGTFPEIFKIAPDGVSGNTPPRFPISPTTSQIIKTASRTSVNNGEPIIYTIKLQAPACAPTITVTDTVPQNAVFVTFREQSPADPIPDTNPIQSITRTGPDDQRKITWTITLKDGRYTTPCSQQRGGGILRDVNYITRNQIDALIAGSPIADKGELIQNLATQHQVNPMLVLAIFQRETQMGRTGPGMPNPQAQRRTPASNYGCNNLGNMRNGSYAYKHGALRTTPGTNLCTFGESDHYALFPNYENSIRATFDLLDNYYLRQRGATTVEQIANIYSPPDDNVGSNIANQQECGMTNETVAQQANRIFKEIISCSLAQKRFCRVACQIFELDETNVNSNTVQATLQYEVTANTEEEGGCITNRVTAYTGNEPTQQNIIGTGTTATSVGRVQCGAITGNTIAEAANNLLGPERNGPLVRCIDQEHILSRKPCRAEISRNGQRYTASGTGERFYSHHLNFDGDANEENIYRGAPPEDGFAWFWCTWTPIKAYQAVGKNALNGEYSAEGQREVFRRNNGYLEIRSSRSSNPTSLTPDQIAQIRPGDVIFFFTRNEERSNHVGIVYSINIDMRTGDGNIETRESNSTVKSRIILIENFKIGTSDSNDLKVSGFGLQDSIQ